MISVTCEKWCHGVAGGRCSLSPPSLSTSEEVGQSQIVQIQGVLLVLPHLLHLDLALECTEANPFACRSWPRLWIPTSNSWRTGGWWNLESNRCYLEIWNSVWIRVWLQIAPNHPKPSTPRNQVRKSSKSNALFGVIRTSRAQAESGPWVVELTWNVLKPMIQCIHAWNIVWKLLDGSGVRNTTSRHTFTGHDYQPDNWYSRSDSSTRRWLQSLNS